MNKYILDELKGERGYYIQKDKPTNEKYLFILPCNGGARKGNYFLGSGETYSWNSWRATDYYLRNFRSEFYMAACSSVNFHFDDLNGAFVFEHEMNRVQSKDDYGKSNYSLYKKEKFDQTFHKDMVKVGLKRALQEYNFQHIYMVINVLFYKYSICKAVEELDIWDKVTFCNVNVMGMMPIWIKLFSVFYRLGFKHYGILNNKYFNFVNVKKNTPEGFNFYNYSMFKDITKELDLTILNILDYNNNIFYFPILTIDKDLKNEEIYDLYKLNSNWRILSKFVLREKLTKDKKIIDNSIKYF